MSKLKKQRKNYFDCALRNRYKQKSAILKQTQEISQFCKSIGLKINEIILSPDDEDPFTIIKTKITVLSSEIPEERIIFSHLKAKDIAQISNRNYRLQRKALLGIQMMPGIKKVLKIQYKLDEFFEVKFNAFSRLNFKIKLNIDSTSISKKNIALLNVSFNLMDDIDNSSNVNGTYILGSFEIQKEDYVNVKEGTKELFQMLENLKKNKIRGSIFQITYFLGCDYKMIRILYCQQSSNAIKG
jgi:hypothetical protein